jgi:hypothetical protein
MFFTHFHNKRRTVFISTITYLLFFCFVLSISGCENTRVIRESPGYLELFNNGRVQASQIILKDGNFIDVNNRAVYFYKKYKDTSDVLVYINFDTVKTTENGKDVLRLVSVDKLIPLSNVKEVYVTKTELDAGKTILLCVGIIAVAALGFLIIAFASFASQDHHSCPYIYSFDGKNYMYDAEPLGGAICEGLARTDYSRLDYLVPSGGEFKLLIKNENDEIQYLDEMKMLAVRHDINSYVTLGQDNNFYKYKEIAAPISVTDENKKDVTKFFAQKDNVKWQTDFPADVSSNSMTEKHKLHFKFDKPAGAKSAMLYINGGTAQWGSAMVKEFLLLRGNKLDEWYKSVYPGSEAQKELYNFMLNEELYYLKINLKENGTYVHRATLKGGGPKADEDILINIPFENISGNFIEIELNPPPGFWKFDRISMVYDYEKIDNADIQVLDEGYAIDNNKVNISGKLNSTDKNYYVMDKVGSSFDLKFNVPAGYNDKEYALFLKTSGWYELILDKTKAPDNDLLSSFIKTPQSVLKYSQKLLIRECNKITEQYNKLQYKF